MRRLRPVGEGEVPGSQWSCEVRDITVRHLQICSWTSAWGRFYATEIGNLPAHQSKPLTTPSPKAGGPNFKTTATGGGEPLMVCKPLTFPVQ